MEEKEEKEEKEENLLHHISHDHPLTLIETQRDDACDGCRRHFTNGEAAYGCSKKCGSYILLHEECAEMPREIRHPLHPQHILGQEKFYPAGRSSECAVCEGSVYYIGYYCAPCKFGTHLGCSTSICAADEEEENRSMKHHPSHPQHELRLLRRKKSSSFECDACGTIQKGNSYVCITCQYLIHESCASLPTTMELRGDLHHHAVSLAFHAPPEYIKFRYKCDICREDLLFRYWVYHCQLCRYVVHTKCIFKTPAAATSINSASAADDENVIQFPISDASEQLIRPLIMRERGVIPHEDEIINGKYKFQYHHHQLSLISLEEKDDDDDDEYDDVDHRARSELICDGCITPIYQKKHESSSSSSPNSDKYYSCAECKYFLHLACFHLPSELSSHPFHQYCSHKLMLKTCGELNFEMMDCRICYSSTSGLFYACTQCGFKIDIKCASLPNTIKHAAHPHHHLCLLECGDYFEGPCDACRDSYGIYYKCDSCKFRLHPGCALLPATNKHRRDKPHPLPLTYDANIDHPGEFYCDFCEEEMNPKMWMYHCRECDQSVHPDCFPSTSGLYRNVNFGQQYVIPTRHPHPLTYQLITTNRRCNLCHNSRYRDRGFQCASCNFVMCPYCHWKHKDAIEAIL